MDYNKIEEPCFVCQFEDSLNESRGSYSHPINCGWNIKNAIKGYEKGLSDILTLCDDVNNLEYEEFVKHIKNFAVSTLVGRYDINEN